MMVIRLPWLPGPFQGLALFGRLILVQRGHEGLIPHEKVHIAQQRRIGALRYHWRWLTDWRFRAGVEIEAYRKDGLTPREIADRLGRFYGIYVEENWVRVVREEDLIE